MRFLFILFLLSTAACRTKTIEWQTLDFGAFKLTTPQGWKVLDEQGIDSYFGGLTNGKDSLWFDYGRYSVDLSEEDVYKHRYAKDTVNGFPARIMKPDTAGKGYISMSIPRVTAQNKFTIWGKNIQETDVILSIYKSLVFKNSDTLINPQLTDSKFIYARPGDGKFLFVANCASCHTTHSVLTGPALYDVFQKRNNEWLYTFLTNRKKVLKDSLFIALTKKYDNRCVEFPDLTKEDVASIIDYIRID